MKKNVSSTQAITLEILKYLGIGILVSGILVCPNLAQLYSLIDPKRPHQRRRIRRHITQMQKEGLIQKTNDIESPLIMTRKGRYRLVYESLTIKTQNKWDGSWRLCIFDIPETHKVSRRVFSNKISMMGMHQYQKSVYITPYDCKEEIETVTTYVHVNKFVRLIVASKIDGEKQLKHIFNLK